MIGLKLLVLFAIICNSNPLILPPTESEDRSDHISEVLVYGGTGHIHISFECSEKNIENLIFNDDIKFVTTQTGNKLKADIREISFFYGSSKCRFPKIPDNFKFQQFRNLEIINLSNLELETYEMKPMWNEERVTKIIATNNRLSVISPKVFPISEQIEELNLETNSIHRIDPETFRNAKSLKKVNFARNRIVSIQSHCFSVPSLVELDLSHNKLEGVSAQAFEGAIDLYLLDLSFNTISNLKAGTFDNLPKLEYLKLKGAGIGTIDSRTFLRLPKLGTIDLSENLVEKLDFSKLKLPNVEYIDLSQNKLTEIKGFRNAIMPKLLQMKLLGNDFSCSHLINLMAVRWRVFRGIYKDPFVDPTKPIVNRGHVNGVICKVTPIDDSGTNKEGCAEKDKEKEKEREREREKEREREQEREKEREREREIEREQERQREKEREQEREKEKEREQEREKEREKEREREQEREREREREKEKERERERNREQEREHEKKREKEREKERERKKENDSSISDNASATQQSINALESDLSFVKYSIIVIFVLAILYVGIKSCLCRSGRFNFVTRRQRMDYPANTELPGQITPYYITEKN